METDPVQFKLDWSILKTSVIIDPTEEQKAEKTFSDLHFFKTSF